MRLREALAIPVIPRDTARIAATRDRFLDIVGELAHTAPPLPDPLGRVGATPFLLAYHALDDRPLQEGLARAYAAMCPDLTERAPAAPGGDSRIRIGFVSEHLFGHTIGVLNLGLIERLPRDRFHVTLFSPPRPRDPLRDRLFAAAQAVVELPGDLAGARRRIADQRCDLLYYPDIGMAPFSYFLAFARLAPVQCLSWGHPDTTGIPSLDLFLSCDAMEPPDGERHYAETLVRLPGPTVFYERPAPAGAAGEPSIVRRSFGLPEDAHLYVCPQSLFKFHPDFDAVLSAILERDPRGLLILIDPRGHAPALLRRFARTAPALSGRVLVLPGQGTARFIALMAACDVMLDPLHYSGGNTSLEALAQGTPIVTWPGAFMRGRHTFGFYTLMGMHDLVARDPAHYVDLAVALGTDPVWRAAMRRRILETNGVLFENAPTIVALADALERAAIDIK